MTSSFAFTPDICNTIAYSECDNNILIELVERKYYTIFNALLISFFSKLHSSKVNRVIETLLEGGSELPVVSKMEPFPITGKDFHK